MNTTRLDTTLLLLFKADDDNDDYDERKKEREREREKEIKSSSECLNAAKGTETKQGLKKVASHFRLSKAQTL